MKNTVTRDFYDTDGCRSGYWTNIEIPSHWEQQDFGSYNYGYDYHTYGREFKYAAEKGLKIPCSFMGVEFQIPPRYTLI